MDFLAVNQMSQIGIGRPAFFMRQPYSEVSTLMVYIGQSIKEELERQERTVSWLARKLNCTRAGVYRIFAKNSIDTQLLSNISRVLHRNFFLLLADDVEQML